MFTASFAFFSSLSFSSSSSSFSSSSDVRTLSRKDLKVLHGITKNHHLKRSLNFRPNSSSVFFLHQSQVNYKTKLLHIIPFSSLSISLEDSYINISNCPPACPPSFPSPVPCPPYSPPSSFSTFHPPGEDRTSPEGSSSGEADQDMEEREQLEGESDKRGEDKGPKDAEGTACNMTSVEDDNESLYAKVGTTC